MFFSMTGNILTPLMSIVALEFAFNACGSVLTEWRRSFMTTSPLKISVYLEDWLDAEDMNQ